MRGTEKTHYYEVLRKGRIVEWGPVPNCSSLEAFTASWGSGQPVSESSVLEGREGQIGVGATET